MTATMTKPVYDLVVLPELEEYLPMQGPEKDAEFETVLERTGGPINPIWVWRGKKIVVDGHRRYRLCKKRSWPYDVREIDFADLEDAKNYMDECAVRQRNLSPIEMTLAMGRLTKYEASKGSHVCDAASRVAERVGVSPRTVYRAVAASKSFEKLAPEIQERVRTEDLKISTPDIQALAGHSLDDQRAIVAEFDREEFASLHDAIHGEGATEEDIQAANLDSEPDDFPTEPQPGSDKLSETKKVKTPAVLLREAQEALGYLWNRINNLDEAIGKGPQHQATCGHLNAIGKILRDRESEVAA